MPLLTELSTQTVPRGNVFGCARSQSEQGIFVPGPNWAMAYFIGSSYNFNLIKRPMTPSVKNVTQPVKCRQTPPQMYPPRRLPLSLNGCLPETA